MKKKKRTKMDKSGKKKQILCKSTLKRLVQRRNNKVFDFFSSANSKNAQEILCQKIVVAHQNFFQKTLIFEKLIGVTELESCLN